MNERGRWNFNPWYWPCPTSGVLVDPAPPARLTTATCPTCGASVRVVWSAWQARYGEHQEAGVVA